MPEVPVVRNPSVKSNPVPGYRQSAAGASQEAFGGAQAQQVDQLGRAVGRVGDKVFDAVVKEQERQDADALFASEQQLQKNLTDWSAKAAQERVGEAAKGYSDEAAAFFDQTYGEINGTLTNPRQQALLAKSAARMRGSFLDGATRHQQREEKAAREAHFAGALSELQRSGITDPSPVNLARVLDQGQARIRAHLAIEKGITDPAVVDAEVRKWENGIHTANVLGMLDSAPEAAVEYISAHGEFMDPKSRIDLEDKAKRAATEKQVRLLAAPRIAAGESLEAVLEAVREEAPAGYEEVAERAVMTEFGRKRQIDADNSRRLLDNIHRYEAQNSTLIGAPESTIAALERVDPGAAARIRRAQAAEAKNRAEGRGAYAPVDDAQVRDQLLQEIRAGNIKPFELPEYRSLVTEKTYRALDKAAAEQSKLPADKVFAEFERIKGKKWEEMGETERAEMVMFDSYVRNDFSENMQAKDLKMLADRWASEAFWLSKGFFAGSVNLERTTYGEAYSAGRRQTLGQVPPPPLQDEMDSAVQILSQAKIDVPVDNRNNMGTPTFYARYGFDGVRWLSRNGIETTPVALAAYAYVKNANRPTTKANFEHALRVIENRMLQPPQEQ